jgi:hypothetical protein
MIGLGAMRTLLPVGRDRHRVLMTQPLAGYGADDDPLRLVAIAGVAMALDQGRSLEAA